MPFAVALLCHPAGAYGCLVAAFAALVYACHARTFVPAFTALAAGLLTTLAFLHVHPDWRGVWLVALGVAVLHCEFRVPTYGAALATGLATSVWGSWLLLAPPQGATTVIAAAPKLALALMGTAVLLAASLRGLRRRISPG